eukprot:CAMPEP_0202884654 /NCGR_PEP_ID=MMETSP1391-20130828/41257_1 /ASSEMBLY_ACC=CAM_ASM_000867 /TAXON_ID=1034604 /ORGANISM="Chlamydomonas leiostraca, Strain SAG 11-49" /LENGTH=54 /DNA_ID=CAMNT_0049567875 /DNA_START=65 /DNA_END=229 /DNA_ORIENTATION=-
MTSCNSSRVVSAVQVLSLFFSSECFSQLIARTRALRITKGRNKPNKPAHMAQAN